MTVQEFLELSTKTLKQSGVASARLDSLILLEDATGRDRAQLLAHPEVKIPHLTEVSLNKKIVQRAQHIPLAYVRGKAEFYGREFIINEHVLVPRPETETMIDLLKIILRTGPTRAQSVLVDVGTGCGAIAVTAKLEFPAAKVIATDIDPKTLKVARQNAKNLAADIVFLQGSLLEPLGPNVQRPTSIILANLPYVPERYAINQAAEHEPKHAIFGGKDGLNLYRRLWEQIAALKQQPKFVFTESLPPQHSDMAALARPAGYKLRQTQDFIQIFKAAS